MADVSSMTVEELRQEVLLLRAQIAQLGGDAPSASVAPSQLIATPETSFPA
eukprot:SAG31_NODE_34977_length_327_cov_0.921053_1_plen_50_part_01